MQTFGLSPIFLDQGAANMTGTVNSTGGSLINILNNVNSSLLYAALLLIVILFVLLFIFIFVPIWKSQDWAQTINSELLKKIDVITASSFDSATKKELIEKIIDAQKEPRGIIGLTRRTIATTILLVIGIAVIMVVLISDNSNLVSTVFTSLTSVFATVVGFYFGGEQAKDMMSKTPQGASATAPKPPTIKSISPSSGPAAGGKTVTITGSGFYGGGSSSAVSTIKFGSNAATTFNVISDTSITAESPAGSAGKVNVTVTTSGGTSSIVAGCEFDYT
jgi:hypothetical protein